MLVVVFVETPLLLLLTMVVLWSDADTCGVVVTACTIFDASGIGVVDVVGGIAAVGPVNKDGCGGGGGGDSIGADG